MSSKSPRNNFYRVKPKILKSKLYEPLNQGRSPGERARLNGKAQPFLTTGGEAVPKENLVKKEEVARLLRRLKSAFGSPWLVEYPRIAMNKTSKRVNGKNRGSGNSVKRTKRSAAKSRTRTIAVAGNNSFNSETKEERQRRLAKR